MKLTLEVWRQPSTNAQGTWERHELDGLEPAMSILEMLDALNEQLIANGKEQVAFESDCREGICGACGLTVNGLPHGPENNLPACHQRLRHFKDGDTVRIEPLRSASYPVVRDLIVDRSALDRIVIAGGHVALDAGTAPDADTQLINHEKLELAMDFAACIGCGACVAACPNGAAHLYLGAKLAHLSMLPVPRQERDQRAKSMVAAAETTFGPCSNFGECAKACPENIPLAAVAAVNKERMLSGLRRHVDALSTRK